MVGGTLGVTGASTLSTLGVSGATTVGTTLGVTGVSMFGSNVSVTGTITATGAVSGLTLSTISGVSLGTFTMGASGISVNRTLWPTASTWNLGLSSVRWLTIYGATVNYLTLTNGSDRRHKKNIVDCRADSLSIIEGLRLRNFEWNDDLNVPGVQLGVIAQECVEVDERLVEGGDADFLSVRTDRLLYHAIGAIQRLSSEVRALRHELKTNVSS
jgi:hypothetical protein